MQRMLEAPAVGPLSTAPMPSAEMATDLARRFHSLHVLNNLTITAATRRTGFSRKIFASHGPRALDLLATPGLNVSGGVKYNPDGSRWSPGAMAAKAGRIYAVHRKQDVGTRDKLQEKWSRKTLLGRLHVWDLMQLLHFTIDHSDHILHYTSQLIHCLQVYNGITRTTFDPNKYDARYQRDMQLAALIHDLGKLLTLFGEQDGNVDCMNRLIQHTLPNASESGPCGLGNMQIQWNHDEYGYQKLRLNPRLPRRVLATVRTHSLREIGGPSRRVTKRQWDEFSSHLTPEDKEDIPFVMHMRLFDQKTKRRTDVMPDVDIGEVLQLLEEYFEDGMIEW